MRREVMVGGGVRAHKPKLELVEEVCMVSKEDSIKEEARERLMRMEQKEVGECLAITLTGVVKNRTRKVVRNVVVYQGRVAMKGS